jgi:hypothetical protein
LLLPGSALPGLAKLFQRRYITGTFLIATLGPFYAIFIFSGLWISQYGKSITFKTQNAKNILIFIDGLPYRWHLGQ